MIGSLQVTELVFAVLKVTVQNLNFRLLIKLKHHQGTTDKIETISVASSKFKLEDY